MTYMYVACTNKGTDIGIKLLHIQLFTKCVVMTQVHSVRYTCIQPCFLCFLLNSNLWVDIGLVNGAMGTVQAICYRTGGPPGLPIAVIVQFDCYSGPIFPDGTVSITPLCCCWSSTGGQCSRFQLPLKLAWAVTTHKFQGLTLDKVVIDIGRGGFSTGLTFIACSRVRQLQDLLFSPPLLCTMHAAAERCKIGYSGLQN